MKIAKSDECQALKLNKYPNNAISWFFTPKSVLTVKYCLSTVLLA